MWTRKPEGPLLKGIVLLQGSSVSLSQPLGVGSPLGQEELKTVPGASEAFPVGPSLLAAAPGRCGRAEPGTLPAQKGPEGCSNQRGAAADLTPGDRD